VHLNGKICCAKSNDSGSQATKKTYRRLRPKPSSRTTAGSRVLAEAVGNNLS
jgi:hypothetical protein